jgi:hypothetical protein
MEFEYSKSGTLKFKIMKTLKLSIVLLLTAFFFSSCIVVEDDFIDDSFSLNQLLQSQDLWYIDSNQTTGSGDTRILSLAFTLSFQGGNLFANNNLVGLGAVGNGFGDQIGFYDTVNHTLEIDHDIDGFIDLEVIQITNNRIKLVDHFENVTYTLIGYSRNSFDYDLVFYDNIEYFLQEYVAWEKTYTSAAGTINDFDNENFLAFIPENINVFQSSQDVVGTNIDNLLWDFTGDYEVFDVQGTDELKVLTLNYDSLGNEEFELSVIDDVTISLYHISSGTTYEFSGNGNIIFKKQTQNKSQTQRKRYRVKRKVKTLKKHITKVGNRTT